MKNKNKIKVRDKKDNVLVELNEKELSQLKNVAILCERILEEFNEDCCDEINLYYELKEQITKIDSNFIKKLLKI